MEARESRLIVQIIKTAARAGRYREQARLEPRLRGGWLRMAGIRSAEVTALVEKLVEGSGKLIEAPPPSRNP